MQCPIQDTENAEILLDYCGRRLRGEPAGLLERHVEICPACRDFLGSQRAVWLALDAWEAAEISPDFGRRLYRRIEEEDRKAWWQRFFVPMMPSSRVARRLCRTR